MSVGKILKREFWSAIGNWLASVGIKAAWPFIITGATFIGAWFQGFPPLPYLMASLSLIFMAMGIGVIALGDIIFQSNPEGKLAISGVIIGKRYAPGGGKKLLGLKYGVHHQTIAKFPIEFQVKPLHVSIGGSINPKPDRTVTGSIAKIGVPGVFWEAEVPIEEKKMKGRLVEGEFEIEISYGRPGNLKFKMIKKYKTYLQFGNTCDLTGFESSEIE